MNAAQRVRIYLTGVGGQGTLTATNLLAHTALDQGISVVAGEVHGMAQRGGVVESFILLGGWKAPRLSYGEADVIMGFEPLETLRALPYLAPGGVIFTSTDPLPPPGVALGRESYPSIEDILSRARAVASHVWSLPCRSLGKQAGAVQSGNAALLGAACASGALPFGPEALEATLRTYLAPRLVAVNLHAMQAGVDLVRV